MHYLPQKPINTQQLAEFLGIALITVYRHTEKGLIPHHRIGKRIIFTPDDIEQYLNSCTYSMISEVVYDKQ